MRCIDYPLINTGQIHKLSADYLSGKPEIRHLFAFEPSLAGAKSALEQRKKFPVNRTALTVALKKQYSDVDAGFFSDPQNNRVAENIRSLENERTFTVTTGHQLNIFTGPLYFIYKIISAIKYAEILNETYPEFHFVPVYWMATEDHDFAEINHIHLWGKLLKWETHSDGPVGRLDPKSLADVINEIEKLVSNNPQGQEMIEIFRKAYLNHNSLAAANRFLVHELFKESGLVILDGDDPELKKALIPVMKRDIFENSLFKSVGNTSSQLAKTYKLPVSPREINVFYIGDGHRSRIVSENGGYKTAEGLNNRTSGTLQTELESHPEHFSPNVIMRPMYQEMILPNLAYIGGNNEIAYWLELKDAFDEQNVFFPQLLVRDSALIIGKKAAKDLELLKLRPEDLFLGFEDLKFRFYQENLMEHDAEKDAEVILTQYESLRADLQGLPGDLVANIVKQMNQHVKEVKRWKNEIHNKQLELGEKNVVKLEKLYKSFYPDGEFQERHDNFIPFYMQHGKNWINMLKEQFNPLNAVCHILVEE